MNFDQLLFDIDQETEHAFWWRLIYISKGLFNINNRQKNPENSQPYCPSDSICAYVHTQEQPAKSCQMTVIEGDFSCLSAF